MRVETCPGCLTCTALFSGSGTEVITMEMLGKIRRLYLRDKLSLSEISRRTGLSRNTVKKWLKKPEGTHPSYRRGQQERKLAPYQDWLDQALQADARRVRRDRRTALKLWHDLCAQGFTGSYSRVTEYVRHWRSKVSIRRTPY